MLRAADISVVIPTYRRGVIVLDTVRKLIDAADRPGEILLVDQTESHPDDVCVELERLKSRGDVRRLAFSPPSIPHAMNVGLLEAKGRIVLFLDDDVVPGPGLIAAHAARHGSAYAAVSGQVLQPGQEPADIALPPQDVSGFTADMDFPFHRSLEAEIRNVMAGNLSVDRSIALSIGGFDEQFVGSAFRFETDFARRLCRAGYRILFAPEASLRHLRLSTGGTRGHGDHLRHPAPRHSVGDYYFALRHGCGVERMAYLLKRPFRECINRYYAAHPWMIPVKFASECRAFMLALRLDKSGPRLLDNGKAGTS